MPGPFLLEVNEGAGELDQSLVKRPVRAVAVLSDSSSQDVVRLVERVVD